MEYNSAAYHDVTTVPILINERMSIQSPGLEAFALIVLVLGGVDLNSYGLNLYFSLNWPANFAFQPLLISSYWIAMGD